jgi:hypothetical protein
MWPAMAGSPSQRVSGTWACSLCCRWRSLSSSVLVLDRASKTVEQRIGQRGHGVGQAVLGQPGQPIRQHVTAIPQVIGELVEAADAVEQIPRDQQLLASHDAAARRGPGRMDEQIASLVAQIAQARRKVAAAVAGLGGDQDAFIPGTGEWSLPEILEHLFLAEQAGVNRIWQAAQAARQGGSAWSGDFRHGGHGIDEVIHETWAISSRGPVSVCTTEGAAAAAVPRLRGPLGYWVA